MARHIRHRAGEGAHRSRRHGCAGPRGIARENGPYVYVIRADHTVAVQEVTLGPNDDGFTEILSGVQHGDNVVLDGQSRLAPGVKVNGGQAG